MNHSISKETICCGFKLIIYYFRMYIRFVTFKFPTQSKAESFVSMMSTPLWKEKFDKETKSLDQILIRSGEGKLAGMGIYNSKEDFQKSSKMLKGMFVDLVKSFDAGPKFLLKYRS